MAAVADPCMHFHRIHGTNVRLDESGTQASRVESFANGVCFSRDPLEPATIFLVEIEEKELGWCGHMRIGLTSLDPRKLEFVPEYSLPDLVNLGNSWVFAITRNHNKVATDEEDPNLASSPSFSPMEAYLQIGECKIPKDKLVGRSRPGRYSHILDELFKSNILPATARRSRVGVLYTINSAGVGDMHIVINGEDMGPCARGIPTNQPLYAVVDVFASTKSVRIIQVEYGFPSLQTLCRQVIQKHIINRLAIDWLKLPELLKDYCKYE
ncbi:neuralized-like protein 2 [Callorhinchus milii]|uniref:Neuralized E3 ubiquitin protein ligase 2 n=1 Tax=Callorhinchus milii TaxID=7868 RepID=A0A4W3J191_CALMI|nr:neuralized-like protein 2 [Callorhinchus milii]|eukprot:gi/632939522/ref/XP_007910388.1/ PREDICTED: neuralized-like protein 2 [Callorhinchus milii]